MTQAFLWTDGRYFIEASEVLDENWTLMKQGVDGVLTLSQWLSELPVGSKIGTDLHYISHSDWEKYSKELTKTSKILTPVKKNLVDIVWKEEGKPSVHFTNPTVYDIMFAGVTWQDKVKLIREKMKSRKCDLLVLSALDETAWLFNMRGFDIHCCPVFFSYAIITLDKSILFIDKSRISDFIETHLNTQKTKEGESVSIYPYDTIEKHLKELSEKSKKIWLSPSTPQFLATYAKEDSLWETNPVCIAKSIKNEIELKCIKGTLIKEAAVLCEFFGHIDKSLGKIEMDEYQASHQIIELRAQMEYCVMNSFDSIVCSGSNAAIIHYRPTSKTAKKFTRNEVILIDTGGNYMDGTTDITRTLHFGKPSDIEIECYTTVLKSHIAIATAKFPKGTKGYQIDPFARAPLWNLGLSYPHGTGHGIGMYLNVHEGPQSISLGFVDQSLLVGNVLSNEPGYYKAGSFGIRIESMITVVPFASKYQENDSQFLQFETISLVPMHRSLIDKSLLTPSEIKWLNDFHAKCVEVLTPTMKDLKFNDGLEYLKKNSVKL